MDEHGSYGDAKLVIIEESWTLPDDSAWEPFAGADDPEIEIRIDGTQDD